MTKITGGPRPPNISEVSETGTSAPARAKPTTPETRVNDGFEVSAEQRGALASDGGPIHTSQELQSLLNEIKAQDLGDAPTIAPAPAYDLSLQSVSKLQAVALALPAEDLAALRGLKAELNNVADPHLQRALRDVCDLAELS